MSASGVVDIGSGSLTQFSEVTWRERPVDYRAWERSTDIGTGEHFWSWATLEGLRRDGKTRTLGEATALRVRSVNRLRRRFVIEESAVMVGYEIHVRTPETHKARSVPYPERLAPMIEHACALKGCSSATASTTCATPAARAGSRTR